jgi:hypothetical protein
VPDHGHSAKTVYLPTVSPFFLTLSLSPRRRPSPSAHAPLDRPRPSPSARGAPARPPSTRPTRSPSPRRRPSPHSSPPPRPRPSPLIAPAPLDAPLAAPAPARRRALHAAAPRLPRLVVSPVTPAPRRLARDPPSRPRPNLEGDLYEMIRFNIKSYLYTCFG